MQISFESPPVVEVVAGVALDGIGPETAPLLTAFWVEHARSQFPRLEQQPPYTPVMEEFPSAGATINLMFGVGMPPQRLWALTADGQELLQLQPGWFACNWRKVQPHYEYDRWPARRAAFEHWYQALTQFLVEQGAGEPKVAQCEVTYVNHIRPGAVWRRHGDLQDVFNLALLGQPPLPLEQMTAELQFLIERDGQPRGRLHARLLPAFERDGKTPLYVLELTARGRPDGDGIDGALAFLNVGRSAINDQFQALTTEAMHAEWGRQR